MNLHVPRLQIHRISNVYVYGKYGNFQCDYGKITDKIFLTMEMLNFIKLKSRMGY